MAKEEGCAPEDATTTTEAAAAAKADTVKPTTVFAPGTPVLVTQSTGEQSPAVVQSYEAARNEYIAELPTGQTKLIPAADLVARSAQVAATAAQVAATAAEPTMSAPRPLPPPQKAPQAAAAPPPRPVAPPRAKSRGCRSLSTTRATKR